MTEIISLGCGGGRHQILDQTFRTGGFRVHDRIKLHIDPGPGALLLTNQLGLDPLDLDVTVVSHSHLDHYVDAEVLVEAMKSGSSVGGRFIGSESVIQGAEDRGPVLSKYHQRKVGELISLEPTQSFELRGVKIEATPTKHSDSTGFGLKIHTESGMVGYTGDTEYFEELPEFFTESRVLIANVTRPGNKRIGGHLCIDDLVKILERTEPELAIISHMGMLFLRNSPKKEASYVENKTGVKTIPGFVGVRIEMKRGVKIDRRPKRTEISDFS